MAVAELLGFLIVVLIALVFALGLYFAVSGRLLEQRRTRREVQQIEEVLRDDPPWERPRILRYALPPRDGLWLAMIKRLEPVGPNDPAAQDALLRFAQDAEPEVFRDRQTGQIWVRYYVDNGREGHAYGYWQELTPFPFDTEPPGSLLRQSL